MPHVVGWWPLQEAYGGRDVSGNGNHMELYDVTFPEDSNTTWASPAAFFGSTPSSYGHITNGRHLDVLSFSFVAKVYLAGSRKYRDMFAWQINGRTNVRIHIYYEKPTIYIHWADCNEYNQAYPTAVPVEQWHTLALTYDFPTNTVTIWLEGIKATSTRALCGTAIPTSSEVVIGKSSMWATCNILCLIIYPCCHYVDRNN
jgi:hypothetical protein